MDLLPGRRTFVQLHTVCVLLWLSVQALHIEVQPRKALFRLGQRRQLRCSVHDCPGQADLTWTLLGDKPLTGSVNTSGAESVMTFDPVMIDHEATLLCKVSCGHESKHARASVQVYSFPEAPVIRGQDRLRLGQEATLFCEVSDLYPVELLTLDWLRGDDLMQTNSDFTPTSTSVLVLYSFTPNTEDRGENITCRATLDLQGLAAEDRTRETSVPLLPRYAPVVTAIPDRVTVMSGSSLTLSCSAEGNPEPQISWSSGPAGAPLSRTSQLHLGPATLNQTGLYHCQAANSEGNHTATVEVQVHAPPTNTSITVSPGLEVQEGQEVLVSCRSEGAPAPTLLLRRGGQEGAELHTANSSASFNLSSALKDDSGLYQCHASNQYGSQVVNASITVRALQVELTPPVAAAERGSGLLLTCRASGCLHTVLTWRSPQKLLSTSVQSGMDQQDSMSLLYLEDLDMQDEGRYSCVAECGSVTKTRHTQVHVYSPPTNTSITVSPGLEVQEGQEVLVSCRSEGAPAPTLLLRRGGQEGAELHTANSSASFNLSSALKDDSGLYQCHASNQYGSQVVNASITVRGRSSTLSPELSIIIIIPVVCLAAGLAGVALLLDYLRRSRKKGFYHLARAAPPPSA
ncbi:vascular cell adhesion protein 1b [Genypterus blacodes]|uniref:vascular cell adhesion protein 1b n=1 Tax=Genypterus blacodes TaxID=154954 RepID=UPI003F765484